MANLGVVQALVGKGDFRAAHEFLVSVGIDLVGEQGVGAAALAVEPPAAADAAEGGDADAVFEGLVGTGFEQLLA